MSQISEMSFIVSELNTSTGDFPTHGKHSIIMNGSPRTSTQLSQGDSTASSMNGSALPPGGPPRASTDKITSHDSAPIDRGSSDIPHSNTFPQTIDKSLDTSLRPPRDSAANRRSSPARFTQAPITPVSSSASADANLMRSQAPQLAQRHTLEVPRAAAPRASKEQDGRTSEELNALNGRLSPSAQRMRRGSITLGRRVTRSLHSDLHVDELPQDEEASRWAEAVRQKRASRKRRKEEEEDDRVLVGTKVDQHHVNWITAYNMLTGIRFVVSRINAKLDRDLTDADFTAQHKFSFDITGNEITPGAKYDFKFKDYAPWVFRHLREIFKIDPADYLMSLTSKYILSELGSPGKSGSFFYFSRDYKYIIKTIHHGEHKFLRKILRQYYEHVDKNRNTLLSQFYGLHRVKIPYGRKIHFVVMNNLFPPHRDIHRTFDLKGSTLGREFKEEKLDQHPRATLKDLNWMKRNMHLEFGPRKKDAFVSQMKRDVALLKQLNIMDYSLLIGIHDLGRGNEENLRDRTLQVFQPGGDELEEQPESSAVARSPGQALARTPSKLENARKARELRQIIKQQRPVPMGSSSSKMPDRLPDDMVEGRKDFYFYSDDGGFRATHEDNRPAEEVYYLGIIDCLTRYNTVKKTEHFLKGLLNPAQKADISAVPPDRYGNRFVDFISSTTTPKEQQERESIASASRDPQSTRQSAEAEKSSSQADWTRSTMETANGEATLPVVEEAAESSSVGGKSTSRRSSERKKKESEKEKDGDAEKTDIAHRSGGIAEGSGGGLSVPEGRP